MLELGAPELLRSTVQDFLLSYSTLKDIYFTDNYVTCLPFY